MYLLTGYYPCFSRLFLRNLSKTIKICEADCDIEIIETVWDCAEAMLRLWYGVVWGMVLSVTPGRDYTGKWRQWTGKNRNCDRARLEIPQTVTVLLYR